MDNFENAKQVFVGLNEEVECLIIRNFEGYYQSITNDDHSDIDLLCKKEDRSKVIEYLNAIPRLDKNDGIHYKFMINNVWVPLDIRYVGDGYFDKSWALQMLKTRVYDDRGFYIMNNENYFWSLLYHSLYHKGKISNDYMQRLQQLNSDIGMASPEVLEKELYNFMSRNNYYYTTSKDRYLWYFFGDICKGRIKYYPGYRFRLFVIKCKEYLFCKNSK